MPFLDELAGFEENWKTNAESVFPGWSNGFNLLEDAGTLLMEIYFVLLFSTCSLIPDHSVNYVCNEACSYT